MSKTKTPESAAAVIAAKSYEKEGKKVQNAISKIPKIKSQEDLEKLTAKIQHLKKLAKEATTDRDNLINPLKEVTANIKNYFEPFLSSVKLVEATGKTMINEYLDRLEAQKEKVLDSPNNLEVVVHKVAELGNRGSAAGLSKRSNKVLEIFEEAKIPRKFLVPDTRLITAELKAGKKIAGCKLVEKRVLAI